jgi:hypothetical protein
MTEIEEAKGRLRMRLASIDWGAGQDEADVNTLLDDHDRLEALSTPAPDDPVDLIDQWADRFGHGMLSGREFSMRIRRGDWKLPAPSAIPEATESYEAFVERIEADPSTQWGPDQLRPSAVPEARDE